MTPRVGLTTKTLCYAFETVTAGVRTHDTTSRTNYKDSVCYAFETVTAGVRTHDAMHDQD